MRFLIIVAVILVHVLFVARKAKHTYFCRSCRIEMNDFWVLRRKTMICVSLAIAALVGVLCWSDLSRFSGWFADVNSVPGDIVCCNILWLAVIAVSYYVLVAVKLVDHMETKSEARAKERADRCVARCMTACRRIEEDGSVELGESLELDCRNVEGECPCAMLYKIHTGLRRSSVSKMVRETDITSDVMVDVFVPIVRMVQKTGGFQFSSNTEEAYIGQIIALMAANAAHKK